MRQTIIWLIFLLPFHMAFGQDGNGPVEGTISYVSSNNVYVRFESTEGIKEGDTIFIKKKDVLIPVLKVKTLSSISCLCEPLSQLELPVSQKVIIIKSATPTVNIPTNISDPEGKEVLENPPIAIEPDTTGMKPDTIKKAGEGVHGRISVSSYSSFSNRDVGNHQRMRYVLALNAGRIAGTGLSFESYITFRHGEDDWNNIQDNIYNGLKIYNLSLNYEFNKEMNLWFGRRINPKLSSMGAIDGLQFEKKIGTFTAGILVGSRPDWADYSYNSSLFQAGVYVNHKHSTNKAYYESTLAFVDQENDWNTDRRFLYFQHINRLISNLFFFGSAEIDLYKYTNDKKETTFSLTNLYLSLRYRPIRQLSFSLSYSARNNIIYYETYKSYIDRLLEIETLQGFIFNVNVKPMNSISTGIRAGYRYRPDDLKPSRNIQGYFNILRSKSLPVTVSLTATYLETSYIKGSDYGVRVSRDFLKGKLYGAAGYRNTSYNFYSDASTSRQNNIDLSLSFNAPWKIYISVNYEAFLDKEYNYNSLYINLTKRF